MKWLDNFSYPMLIGVALLLGLAPFQPEPHLVEKLRMLYQGSLSRPVDIFDLLMHGSPLILILLKFIHDKRKPESA